MEKFAHSSTQLPQVISGIDTLFYFYETTSNYHRFFFDLLKTIIDKRGEFEENNISYENRDIKVYINN